MAPEQQHERSWAELPRDVLNVIFQKLGALDVLYPAQAVCREWNSAAADPEFWRCVDMRFHADLFNVIDLEGVAKQAVDRAAGRLEEYYGEYCGSDDLLRCITDRTSSLKCLRLISCYNVSEEGLAEIAQKSPMLEELEVTFSSMSEKWLECVGQACPQLKSLKANTKWYDMPKGYDDDSVEFDSDTEALAIAKTMQQLNKLQIVGNQVTNKGLLAILDNCVHLESLDIRGCYNVKLDGNLRSRLARIRNVRLPHDSTHDYGFMVEAEKDFIREDAYSTDDYEFGFGDGYDYDYDALDYILEVGQAQNWLNSLSGVCFFDDFAGNMVVLSDDDGDIY